MSFPWIRTAAATVVITVAAAGCAANADSVTESPPSTTSTTAAPAATPAAKATPTPTPTQPRAITDGMSTKEILTKTKTAVFAADSVRMRGSFVDAGEPGLIDVQLTKSGGQGTFTIGGGPVGIIVIGKRVYMQLSEKLIRAQGKADKTPPDELNFTIHLFKGKWIKLSKPSKPDSDFDALITLTNRDSFFGQLFQSHGRLKKTPETTVDGVPAIGLADGEGTLWVSTLTALPVRLETGSSGSDETLRFSDYNQLKAPKVPPASQTLDGGEFGF